MPNLIVVELPELTELKKASEEGRARLASVKIDSEQHERSLLDRIVDMERTVLGRVRRWQAFFNVLTGLSGGRSIVSRVLGTRAIAVAGGPIGLAVMVGSRLVFKAFHDIAELPDGQGAAFVAVGHAMRQLVAEMYGSLSGSAAFQAVFRGLSILSGGVVKIVGQYSERVILLLKEVMSDIKIMAASWPFIGLAFESVRQWLNLKFYEAYLETAKLFEKHQSAREAVATTVFAGELVLRFLTLQDPEEHLLAPPGAMESLQYQPHIALEIMAIKVVKAERLLQTVQLEYSLWLIDMGELIPEMQGKFLESVKASMRLFFTYEMMKLYLTEGALAIMSDAIEDSLGGEHVKESLFGTSSAEGIDYTFWDVMKMWFNSPAWIIVKQDFARVMAATEASLESGLRELGNLFEHFAHTYARLMPERMQTLVVAVKSFTNATAQLSRVADVSFAASGSYSRAMLIVRMSLIGFISLIGAFSAIADAVVNILEFNYGFAALNILAALAYIAAAGFAFANAGGGGSTGRAERELALVEESLGRDRPGAGVKQKGWGTLNLVITSSVKVPADEWVKTRILDPIESAFAGQIYNPPIDVPVPETPGIPAIQILRDRQDIVDIVTSPEALGIIGGIALGVSLGGTIGFALGGPIGLLVGAAIGAIVGGVLGAIGGSAIGSSHRHRRRRRRRQEAARAAAAASARPVLIL